MKMSRSMLIRSAVLIIGGLLSDHLVLPVPLRPIIVTSPSLSRQVEVKAARTPLDVYHFPIKPGMPEWKTLKTHEEMLSVTQIPPEVLNNISTAGLVETVLNYPLRMDLYVSSSSYIQDGFDRVVTGFNGLQALLAREDSGRELLMRYRAVDLASLDTSWTDIQKGNYIFDLTFMELLLAQTSVIETLSPSERLELAREATTKSQLKKQWIDVYGRSSLESTALILSRLRGHTH